MLTHELAIQTLKGSTAEGGATHNTAATVAAHVELGAFLKLDERPTSNTYGAEIAMRLHGIVQLDRAITPGALVTYLGVTYQVGQVRHYEHRAAPSHSELWGA